MASPDSPLKVAPPEAETLRDELAQVYSANSVSAKKLPVDSSDSTAPLAADPTASLAGEFLSESPAVDNSHMQGAALKAYGTHTRKDREDKLILDFFGPDTSAKRKEFRENTSIETSLTLLRMAVEIVKMGRHYE